jgi:ATP/maltotriose-dependent transcriptional regulator MalT
VSAPAGFGKMTLLGQKVTMLVIRLSLDENDDELFCFLNYFVTAIQILEKGLG